MADSAGIVDILTAIRSASALIETTFLQTGETLDSSISILARLTTTFDTVVEELTGESLGAAREALSQTATHVASLAVAGDEAGTIFAELRHLVGGINARIAHMTKSLKSADALAISSKIAAASIRASDVDFSSFAAEIDRTLRLTGRTLDSFSTELKNLHQRISCAQDSQQAFAARRAQAATSIPVRLTAAIDAIGQQHRRAAEAGVAVRHRSEAVQQQVCVAITALQIGDMTRQRLEHTEFALDLVASSPIPTHDMQTQRAFTRVTCRLQSEQMADAAQKFGCDIHQITHSLEHLATEASALRGLGAATYGDDGRGQGSAMLRLERELSESLSLFEGFNAARANAADVVKVASTAADTLCDHLRKVQSLEADIRIMGLNTSLKCSRLGVEGLALGVIAQELRSYANEFARDAGLLMSEVGKIVSITGGLTVEDTATPTLIKEVTSAMTGSLTTLQHVGTTVNTALVELDRDSREMERLLRTTLGDLASKNGIGATLRRTAADLAVWGPEDDLSLAELSAVDHEKLARMLAGYTMAAERAVYANVLRQAPTGTNAPAEFELEDMLF